MSHIQHHLTWPWKPDFKIFQFRVAVHCLLLFTLTWPYRHNAVRDQMNTMWFPWPFRFPLANFIEWHSLKVPFIRQADKTTFRKNRKLRFRGVAGSQTYTSMGTGTVQISVQDEEENMQTITLNNVAVTNGMRIISVHQLINDEQNKYSIDFRRNNIIIEKDDRRDLVTCIQAIWLPY